MDGAAGGRRAGVARRLSGPAPRGASIQARLYAEDPAQDFQPAHRAAHRGALPDGCAGRDLGRRAAPRSRPSTIRCWPRSSSRRRTARTRSAQHAPALAETQIARHRDQSRLPARRSCAAAVFAAGDWSRPARWRALPYRPRTIEVLQRGTQTTVQDYPGRLGYWDVGVPPSGPMDAPVVPPRQPPGRQPRRLRRRWRSPSAGRRCSSTPHAVVALTGAHHARDARRRAGALLAGGAGRGRGRPCASARSRARGCAAYLAVAAASTCPDYLGSRATFTLGQFGGHAGRALRAGDVLRLRRADAPRRSERPPAELPAALMPVLTPRLGDRGALRPARRAGLLHPSRHRDLLRRDLARCTTTPPAPACA